LVRLFATSEFLSAFFLRHPELLDSLVRADLMRIVRAREDMAAELGARLAAAPDLEARLDTLRRFRHEEFLRIGVHDIEGTLEPAEVGRQLTSLAETCLAAALAIARGEVLARTGVPDAPESEGLAVLGLGKLGGGEFAYGRGLSPAEVAAIADMRARIERERGAADGEGVNIKTGRGGLIDVEFLVQMLQLRHGDAHPAVRVRDTPGAIGALAAAGLLLPADARALAEGYAFLRELESRLRLEHNQPLEVAAADPAALLSLARRL